MSRVDVPGLASSEFAYDAVGRLEAITRDQRVWTTSYDVDGNLASVVDPLGRTTSFGSYDLARRLLSQTLPGYREVHIGYDASGNRPWLSRHRLPRSWAMLPFNFSTASSTRASTSSRRTTRPT